jgi:hypothetical protein
MSNVPSYHMISSSTALHSTHTTRPDNVIHQSTNVNGQELILQAPALLHPSSRMYIEYTTLY